MAKAPAKTKSTRAPAKDKANRPSPPDRDGDGASGGSLPGNQTDPRALGHAEDVAQHDAAVAQIAADGTATIIIDASTEGRAARPSVGVNGQQRHLDVGVEVQVNAAELEALEASHVSYTVVVPLAAPAEGDAEAASGAEGSSSEAAAPSEEASESGSSDANSGEGTVTEGAGETDPQ